MVAHVKPKNLDYPPCGTSMGSLPSAAPKALGLSPKISIHQCLQCQIRGEKNVQTKDWCCDSRHTFVFRDDCYIWKLCYTLIVRT